MDYLNEKKNDKQVILVKHSNQPTTAVASVKTPPFFHNLGMYQKVLEINSPLTRSPNFVDPFTFSTFFLRIHCIF